MIWDANAPYQEAGVLSVSFAKGFQFVSGIHCGANNRRLVGVRVAALLIFGAALVGRATGQSTAQGPIQFEPAIQRFSALDEMKPPKSCSILFVGSSSFRLWTNLAEDMAPYAVINRGFGGSTIADINYYFSRVVAKYRPRAIMLYAGENDLAFGSSPRHVLADLQHFMDLKVKALGDAPVYFISIKPSKTRADEAEQQVEVNGDVQRMSMERNDLHYLDVRTAMISAGRDQDIFGSDGLHMTHAGYAIWSQALRPVVAREYSRQRNCDGA